MNDAEYCRRKADALLTEAAGVVNMKERGRLIDEAIHWHGLALEAHGQRAWGSTTTRRRGGPNAGRMTLK
jgi:hypothetical protein